jgi:hypothetical protein
VPIPCARSTPPSSHHCAPCPRLLFYPLSGATAKPWTRLRNVEGLPEAVPGRRGAIEKPSPPQAGEREALAPLGANGGELLGLLRFRS